MIRKWIWLASQWPRKTGSYLPSRISRRPSRSYLRDDQERLLLTQLKSRGLRVLSYTEDARRTCAMDHGYTGNHTPSFVVHYFTPDLATLPGLLEQRIQSGRYHTAAVGACKPDGKANFAQYRVAVMLFE